VSCFSCAYPDEGIRLFREIGGGNYIHTFSLIDKKTAPLYYLLHLSNSPVALTVMRDVTWAYNNLDFQYQYNIHGYGQIALEEYEQNLTIINVDDENIQFCIDTLSEQLGNFISVDSNSSFIDLYNQTLQKNPATKDHYVKALNQLQSDKDIVVIRDGKIKDIKRILPKDVIQRIDKQITIFGSSQYRINIPIIGESNLKKKTIKPQKAANNNSEQLGFEGLITND
jgi:hypothetical protein